MHARDEPAGPHDPNGTGIAALRVASPTFESRWRQLTGEWESDAVPQYLAMSAFASHLKELLKSGATGEVSAAFDCVEGLLESADPGVRYLVTWGLIEDLGNGSDLRWPETRILRSLFGPRTSEAWDEVDRTMGQVRIDPPSRDTRRG